MLCTNYDIDGVVLVKFPGVDGILSSSKEQRSEEVIELIRSAVSISAQKHGSHIIAVVGHHDCAGNPGDSEHHNNDIRSAMREISSWNFTGQIVGLCVNDKRQIEVVK
jgi:carbonic anhydrase-like protein